MYTFVSQILAQCLIHLKAQKLEMVQKTERVQVGSLHDTVGKSHEETQPCFWQEHNVGEQPPLSFMSLSRVWATLSSQSFSCHHWLGACDDSGPNQRSSQKPSFQPKLPLRVTWSLWPSPGADQHRLGGLKLQKWVLSVQEAGSGSRGVSRAVPPQSSQGEPFLVCTGFWRLQAFLALWLHHSSLCLRCSHHLSLPL